MNEILKKEIEASIKNNLSELPFIARYWEVTIGDISYDPQLEKIKLGKYNAIMKNAYPFYKSISKIVDINRISE